MYENGELSIEETITRQFATVRGTKQGMLKVAEAARFRPGFERMLRSYLRGSEPLVVASYGVDFCIRTIIARAAPLDRVVLHTPVSKFIGTKLKLSFPRARLKSSVGLKDDIVSAFRSQNRRVIFVGDGPSDLPAVKKADLGFAIKGSRLAALCRDDEVPFTEISSFDQVVPAFGP